MTAGNIQNSKRISLYGSKQTHGIDWQNHFFLFSHLKQFRDDKSHPESLHTTNKKGPKHVTFSPHLPESRWHPLHFLKSLCTYKRKKENTETTVSVSFSRLWGGGTFWPAYRRSCAFPKIRKTTKTKPKKAATQKVGWWLVGFGETVMSFLGRRPRPIPQASRPLDTARRSWWSRRC